MRSLGRYPGIVAAIAVMLMLAACTSHTSDTRPDARLPPAQLNPCPSRPSCVVSTADSGSHAVAPLHYDGDTDAAMARLASIIRSLPRTDIVHAVGPYLHATQRSRVFSFTDDVEFLAQPDQRLIQVRSCSRVGYYDFGVNRNRIDTIRQRFEGSHSDNS